MKWKRFESLDSARPCWLCCWGTGRYKDVGYKKARDKLVVKTMLVTNYAACNYLPVTPARPVPGGVDEVPWLNA